MPRPNHLRASLIAQLRRHIESCQTPGEQLPSQRELALTYGGTQSTIRRALEVLQKDGVVAARPRIGWVRAPGESPPANVSSPHQNTLRVGLISRRRRSDWENHDLLRELIKEGRRRRVELVDVPNPRQSYPTRSRMRIELTQVPWNSFDVGMLLEIEDPITLSNPLLAGKRLLSVDQDSTAFGLSSISFANWEAGAVAARHLFDLGHRRFAVTDEVNSEGRVCDPSWTARRLGYESQLATLGGIIRPEWRLALQRNGRVNPAFSLRKTIKAWGELAPNDRPTALFAISGFHLAGIIQMIEEIGMRIPQDISIIMVTWQKNERFIGGQELTTVYLDLKRLIRRSFDTAAVLARQEMIRGARPLNVIVPVKLTEGKSTRSRPLKFIEYA